MVGFIGAGNMAGAIIGGIVTKGLLPPEEILVSNPHVEKLECLSKRYGVGFTQNNRTVAEQAELLFLCVKPFKMAEVLSEIRNSTRENAIVVSIAAGKSLASLTQMLGREQKLVRVMPNTPAMIGEGICAVCPNEAAAADEAGYRLVLKLLSALGESVEVEERLVDVAGQVAGASPAWMFMVIEALADGAVLEGMPRDMAYRFAAAGVAGAGKLALHEGGNPGRLKDMVTSPAGTTIEGVRTLEKHAVRGAFIEAVVNSCEKSRKL